MGHTWFNIYCYLLPSLFLSGLIRIFSGRIYICAVFRLAGTVMHEYMHFAVGFLLGAKPVSVSLFPKKRSDGSYILGSVTFGNLRWHNVAFVAFAPLLVLLIPYLAARVRTAHGLVFMPLDALLAFVIAPQFLSCWPSRADLRISLISWPLYLIAAGLTWAAFLWHAPHDFFAR